MPWVHGRCSVAWDHNRPQLGVQVWRWAQQYKSQLLGEPMPEMMELIAWLQSHIPAEDADPTVTRISHGDFRCAAVLLFCHILLTIPPLERNHKGWGSRNRTHQLLLVSVSGLAGSGILVLG